MSGLSRKRRAGIESPIASSSSFTLDSSLEELHCSVCLQIFTEPHSLPCGHTFCHSCIHPRVFECPLCRHQITNHEQQLIPNRVLYNLVDNYRKTQQQTKIIRLNAPVTSLVAGLPESLAVCVTDPRLDMWTVTHMMSILEARRNLLTSQDAHVKNTLLTHFLQEMTSRRTADKKQIELELDIIERDLQVLNNVTPASRPLADDCRQQLVPETEGQSLSVDTGHSDDAMTSLRKSPPRDRLSSNVSAEVNETDSDIMEMVGNHRSSSKMHAKKQRIHAHFDDLQHMYLGMKQDHMNDPVRSGEFDLDEFGEILNKSTQYSSIQRLASLNYTMGNANENQLNIVSSIEFDRDGEYLAVAGVTRRIKLYDYNQVVADKIDLHYPVAEMNCHMKISCVSWSQYRRNLLASSDYEGTVQLWDAMAGKEVKRYQEHLKRAWSVNFSNTDPRLLASGSDDAKVKLWSVTSPRSIGEIDAQVNVCCVHFGPEPTNLLAFGCADHCLHLFDVRNVKKPLTVFEGHKKAVSYVKFLNENEIVSASTDGSLRLWNCKTPSETSSECVRTFTGHLNEKNFVGLAGDQDFIVCGSETNTVYLYYKGVSSPLLQYTLPSDDPGRPTSSREPTTGFVSAVACKKKSNVLVAANSQGCIELLKLV